VELREPARFPSLILILGHDARAPTTTMRTPPTTKVATHAAVLSLLLVACSASPKDIDKGKAGSAYTFKLGETVKLECKDWETGAWGKGPVCKETGEEFAITFGYNNFVYCGMEIKDKKFYDHLVAIIKMEKTWQCRIPMNKRKDFYVPFTIPVGLALPRLVNSSQRRSTRPRQPPQRTPRTHPHPRAPHRNQKPTKHPNHQTTDGHTG
jgi:hypothetical protein